MKFIIVLLSFLFYSPTYNSCLIEDNHYREEINGNFELHLTCDSLVITLNNRRFDAYRRDEGLLYKTKSQCEEEMYFLIFTDGICKIVRPRKNYTIYFFND